MYVKNFAGDEFTLQATLTNHSDLNGNQSIDTTIEHNKVNELFINDINRLWSVYDHKDVEFKIQLINRQGLGRKMFVSVKAIPVFFDHLDTHSMLDDDGEHERYDGSLTARNAFKKIFDDTPFDYAFTDSADSQEWENFGGGESKLESFKRALDRYGYEFEIRGSTVFLSNQAGRDTSIQYRHRLNASNIQQEIDASEQYTTIKGYGNFGEAQADEEGGEEDYRDARLKRSYTSPLADIIGVRHSPPFVDGRVKIRSVMDRKLKSSVDNSLKVSVSADVVNLSKQGYPIDQSMVGDRVFLIDERIGYNEEVRIVAQSITRNWKGEVIDASITFGGEGLGKRHQSDLTTAVKNITDIFEGKKEMPLSLLDKRVREISNIINGNVDSVMQYMPNGIIGHNGDDPNYMLKIVADAIGLSRDGGKTFNTAMSADLGIVADYITTGTLKAITIEGVDIYGSGIYGGIIEQSSGSRKIVMEKGRINSYTDNDLGMSFGQYSLDFYNESTDPIGKFGTSYNVSDPSKKGLALVIENDFFNLGIRRQGLIRPILRTSLYDNVTSLSGPFNSAIEGSALRLYANRRLGARETDWNDDASSIDQPSIILDQSGTTNTITQYFGGMNNRNSATWQVRHRVSEEQSNLRLEIDKDGALFRGDVKARDFVKSSSIDYKQNINRDLNYSSLDIVNSWKVVEFEYKQDEIEMSTSLPVVKQIGLISEENPSVASPDGKGISEYSQSSHLSRAVQELSKKVDVLERELKQ